MPSMLLYYAQIECARPRGRPKKRWIANIQEDCSAKALTVVEAYRLAHDRSRWTIAIQKYSNSPSAAVTSKSVKPPSHFHGFDAGSATVLNRGASVANRNISVTGP